MDDETFQEAQNIAENLAKKLEFVSNALEGSSSQLRKKREADSKKSSFAILAKEMGRIFGLFQDHYQLGSR